MKQAIYFDDGGQGDLPIIFIHSLAGQAAHWQAQLAYARQTTRAIALTLRGHQGSYIPEQPAFSLANLAQDVATVVNQLNIQRFILVGHSLGASVALHYAAQHSEQVAGLLLADPSGDSTQLPADQINGLLAALESEAYSQVIQNYWEQILAGAAEQTAVNVLQDLENTPKATVVNCMKQLTAYNPAADLRLYSGPMLSINTPLTDLPFAMHKLVDNLPYVLVEGTSHWLQMDRPAHFNTILEQFIESVAHSVAK